MSDRFNTRLTLLQKIRDRHDDEAWNDFCLYYSPYLKAIIRRFLNASADVEDCCQIVLTTLWKSLPKFEYDDKKGRFRSWLVNVTRKKIYSYLQKSMREGEKREALAEERHFPEDEFKRIADEEWQDYIAGMAWKNVKKQFTPQVLEVFQHALCGKANKDIAVDMDLKINTVAVYKKRVRSALHKEILRLQSELA